MKTLVLLSTIIHVLIVLFILNWFYNVKIHKCNCSNNELLVKIEFYWRVILFLGVINIIFGIAIFNNDSFKTFYFNYLMVFYLIFVILLGCFHIYNFFNTIIYFRNIEKDKGCICDDYKTKQKKFIYVWTIIVYIITLLSLLILIPSAIAIIYNCGFFKIYKKGEKCNIIYKTIKREYDNTY